jgi:hypothetical protein
MGYFMEQYRLYLHVFNNTVDRRHKSNEFFLGINTALIAIIGYVEAKGTVLTSPIIFVIVPLIGVALCVVWHKIIHSYKLLNRAKFKVIHSLERNLPAALFETEWELLGRGHDHKKYWPLSQIEKTIPLIFIVLYLVIFFATVLPSDIGTYLSGMFN